jgi:transketolase
MGEQKSMPGTQSNLDVFAQTLEFLAESSPDLVVATSDSRGSGKLGPFGKRFPGRMVETGIAEQNLVGVAAGLASAGKKVFAVSPASFLTARSLEQIKNDVAYSGFPVVLVGISAGVSYGALGATHHSLHDLAVLRAINGIDIVVPADAAETRAAVLAAARHTRPLYLRFGRKAMPKVHAVDPAFRIGAALTVREGSDVALVATGETVAYAADASDLLRKEGIGARVVSMHTVKPLDTEALLDCARACRAVITVEEHHVHGGLGEACASALMQSGTRCRFRMAAFPDGHLVSGSQGDLFTHYGLDAEGLARSARRLLSDK